MILKRKSKKDLCTFLEVSFGIVRRQRDIEILEYDSLGYASSFSVKLGCNFLAFSWFSSSIGYEINKNLTFLLNDI